jgi:hypothetical protein
MTSHIALELGGLAAHHALPLAGQAAPEHVAQDLQVQGWKNQQKKNWLLSSKHRRPFLGTTLKYCKEKKAASIKNTECLFRYLSRHIL